MNASTIRTASAAMENLKAIAYEVAKQLSITTAMLYTYINSDGSLKDAGKKLLAITS